MNTTTRNRVAAATCKLVGGRIHGPGQGVVIEGNFILTAAHCIDHLHEASMALGDFCLVTARVNGRKVNAEVLAIEPRADIAVLGALDGQSCPDDWLKYETVMESVTPLPICRKTPKPFSPFPVWIRTHKATWIRGSGTYAAYHSFVVKPEIEVPGGTSGGPIVNEAGEVLGVVSTFGSGPFDGGGPLACMALPAWVLRSIDECPTKRR